MPTFLPAKTFDWIFESNGANQLYIQEVEIPSQELPVHTHGEAGRKPDAKTPGKKQVGQITLKKLIPVEEPDKWAQDLFNAAQNGTNKSSFMETGFFHLTDGNGAIIRTYRAEDVWASKIEAGSAFAAGGEGDNVIESVVLEVRDWEQIV